MYRGFACIMFVTTCMPGFCRDLKGGLDLLELELEMAVSCHVGAVN